MLPRKTKTDKMLDICCLVDANWVRYLDQRRSKVGMCLTNLEEQSVGWERDSLY